MKKQAKPKPKPKHHSPPPPRRTPVTTTEETTTNGEPEQGPATETPKHYSAGTVKPQLGGRDVPKQGQYGTGDEAKFAESKDDMEVVPDDPPPAPAGAKPNDLVSMPPGSVSAPSSFPGSYPPVGTVKVETAENENKDDE